MWVLFPIEFLTGYVQFLVIGIIQEERPFSRKKRVFISHGSELEGKNGFTDMKLRFAGGALGSTRIFKFVLLGLELMFILLASFHLSLKEEKWGVEILMVLD